MEHWLGRAVMERYILRVLRQAPTSLTCEEITERVVAALQADGCIRAPKELPPPTALWVYYFLLLLGSNGRVEKFACVQGTIRYKLRAYVRAPR